METWKSVANYEGIYEVSDAGRLRRATDHKILKPFRTRNGYIHATLVKNGKKTQMLMHRVVATAFIEKPKDKNVVNHINCNPSDNRVCNLEWTTQSANVKYAYDLGRADNAARKRIICKENGREFYSSVEAATWVNDTQFHSSHNVNTISRTIRGAAANTYGRRSAYGLHWCFT